MAVLKQNQFEFDDETVLNTVMMGHASLWLLQRDAKVFMRSQILRKRMYPRR
jgi:hypothetical protein